MKSKYLLFTLFFLSIIQFTMAQVTPIETIIDAKKTTYKTNQHNNYISIVKSQPYELRQKLQENIKISDNTTNSLFVKDCLNGITYTSLRNNKIMFSIEYVCNQNGDVLSCSLINYGNRVSLSNTEVECILTEALNNTFSFNNIPSDVNNFYYIVKKLIKFK